MGLKGTIISLHQFPPLLSGFAAGHTTYKCVFQNHSEELFLLNASEIEVIPSGSQNSKARKQLAV